MGKKKPFIDRKTASVYHVVRRSQRDVGTEATAETLSDFVLMADPENAKRNELKRKLDLAEGKQTNDAAEDVLDEFRGGRRAVDFNTLKAHYESAGLLDSTAATYSKFTKPINRGGMFIDSATGDNALGELLTDTSKNNLDTALQEAMEVHEVGRMLDSIALSADCMEEDVAQALFDFEEGEFEEILDDFCLTANQEPEDDEVVEGFNFEEHIRALIEKARLQENGGGEGRALEDDFFAGVAPLHARIEEEDDEDHFDYDQYNEEEDSLDREFNGKDYSKPMNDEQQRVLCQQFEEALLEYDSDDVGDLDDECEEIVGSRPLEGDTQLDAALDEFLNEKEDEIFIEGTKSHKEKRTGGSGYSALVGKTLVPASQLDESKTLLINIEESKKQMQKDLAEADAILANPEMDLPPEEILIDGKSYFSISSRNPWDCESILSTYSNLDNNPVVIGRSSRRGKKKSKKKTSVDEDSVIPEDKPVKIQLSNKTGLPLGVFDKPSNDAPEVDYYGESDTYISVNKGEARNKDESLLEKKVRKIAVKEERKICRIQKKMMKEAFRDEFTKRGSEQVVDAVGGATVFRFS
jgi:protein LTV1